MSDPIQDIIDTILSGKEQKPRRCVIYGVPAIGKSTFANSFPKPIFIDLEDGLSDIDCKKFPVAKSTDEIMDQLRVLVKADFQTVVIDSADWLEQIIFAELEKKYTQKELGYGKKYEIASAEFKKILDALNYLRLDKNMHVILTAHSEIKKISPPDLDDYDRYQPRLTPKVFNVVSEWATEILFACYEVMTKTSGEGFSEKKKGIGTGNRIVKCNEMPSHVAKNRLSMPDEIEFKFEEYQKFFN